jgi:hypothetical protein
MKHALTAVAVFVAALTLAGVATASQGKSRIVVESFSESYAFSADCSQFGPHAFEIDVVGSVKVRVTDVVAANGELLQTVIHVVFREIDTNSVSGRSVPLHQAATEVWDYASNTRTITGAVFVGSSPGGTWVQDTGRITMTRDTRIASFVAGPHEAFFGGGLDVVACGALAGA